MTRKTSIEVYHRLEASGYFEKRRGQVYYVLYHFGPMTVNETYKKVAEVFNTGVIAYYANSQARFSELRDAGAVEELGKKECSVTGNEITLYDVTGEMPNKYVKPLTNKQKLKVAEKILDNHQLTEIYQSLLKDVSNG